jgi:AhpC/TSA family
LPPALNGGPPAFAGTDGQTHVIPAAPPSRFTVLVFFSKHCHCLSAHDERLRRLHVRYAPLGVQFFAVDSEVSASLAGDADEARQRSYSFPILMDPMGRLARTLGAQSASYAVVLNPQGGVMYEGGIDSDKTHLRDDATPFLANALDDLLAHRPARLAVTNTVGCALHTALHDW